jgi:hypothetical protein
MFATFSYHFVFSFSSHIFILRKLRCLALPLSPVISHSLLIPWSFCSFLWTQYTTTTSSSQEEEVMMNCINDALMPFTFLILFVKCFFSRNSQSSLSLRTLDCYKFYNFTLSSQLKQRQFILATLVCFSTTCSQIFTSSITENLGWYSFSVWS